MINKTNHLKWSTAEICCPSVNLDLTVIELPSPCEVWGVTLMAAPTGSFLIERDLLSSHSPVSSDGARQAVCKGRSHQEVPDQEVPDQEGEHQEELKERQGEH